MRHRIITTARLPETCTACANLIPAWQRYALSWVGEAEDVRREHIDCMDCGVS